MSHEKIKPTIPASGQHADKQISPPVKCFCCQDSGIVANSYLSELVEIPKIGNITPYICQRENCEKGKLFLKAFNQSDQERDAYYNAQLRNGKDVDGLPRPMRSRDYQANFSINLNERFCDWLHDRSRDDWVSNLSITKVNIAKLYFEEVAK